MACASLSLAATGKLEDSALLGRQWIESVTKVGFICFCFSSFCFCLFFCPSLQDFGADSIEAAYARAQLARTLGLSHSADDPVSAGHTKEAKDLLDLELAQVVFGNPQGRLNNVSLPF